MPTAYFLNPPVDLSVLLTLLSSGIFSASNCNKVTEQAVTPSSANLCVLLGTEALHCTVTVNSKCSCFFQLLRHRQSMSLTSPSPVAPTTRTAPVTASITWYGTTLPPQAMRVHNVCCSEFPPQDSSNDAPRQILNFAYEIEEQEEVQAYKVWQRREDADEKRLLVEQNATGATTGKNISSNKVSPSVC